MAKTYDTAELRRVASVIRNSSDEVSRASGDTVRWIRDDIPGHLSGETADALAGTTDELFAELSACSKELNDIGIKLNRLAYMLDQADRQAAEMIQSR